MGEFKILGKRLIHSQIVKKFLKKPLWSTQGLIAKLNLALQILRFWLENKEREIANSNTYTGDNHQGLGAGRKKLFFFHERPFIASETHFGGESSFIFLPANRAHLPAYHAIFLSGTLPLGAKAAGF